MSDQQLIDEVVGYLTKDGAVMDLSRARQGAKLIRRQHSRIEADEALMRQILRACGSGSVTAVGTAITALRKRLETSNV